MVWFLMYVRELNDSIWIVLPKCGFTCHYLSELDIVDGTGDARSDLIWPDWWRFETLVLTTCRPENASSGTWIQECNAMHIVLISFHELNRRGRSILCLIRPSSIDHRPSSFIGSLSNFCPLSRYLTDILNILALHVSYLRPDHTASFTHHFSNDFQWIETILEIIQSANNEAHQHMLTQTSSFMPLPHLKQCTFAEAFKIRQTASDSPSFEQRGQRGIVPSWVLLEWGNLICLECLISLVTRRSFEYGITKALTNDE